MSDRKLCRFYAFIFVLRDRSRRREDKYLFKRWRWMVSSHLSAEDVEEFVGDALLAQFVVFES